MLSAIIGECAAVLEPKKHTEKQTILFISILCLLCGLFLAVISYGLRIPQGEAKEFDRSKQMLIAAKVLNHEGYFEILDKEGKTVKASFHPQTKTLQENPDTLKATDDQIKEVASLRIRPLLTDAQGNVLTLKEKGLDLSTYLAENKRRGYANLPLKLFYVILPNTEEAEKMTEEEVAKDFTKVSAFVIPVSGFGLWAPIYGYIALESNGDRVIGTTWYEMGETPGLGANITTAWWQNQFFGKLIFHESADGKTDFSTADIGIVVVKGKVKDVYGNTYRAKSAVDGISGATLTGDGVTAAYQDSLTPYRPFLMKIHEEGSKSEKRAA
ncbi:MAG: NADH:ubiquinone reductase (Na(+)-transporting) subunit C [Chlamydiales bacterium]